MLNSKGFSNGVKNNFEEHTGKYRANFQLIFGFSGITSNLVHLWTWKNFHRCMHMFEFFWMCKLNCIWNGQVKCDMIIPRIWAAHTVWWVKIFSISQIYMKSSWQFWRGSKLHWSQNDFTENLIDRKILKFPHKQQVIFSSNCCLKKWHLLVDVKMVVRHAIEWKF